MEYNTSLPHLIIPEYGRNVQKMVQSIIKIEDREKRNHQAKAIIEVMGNLNPHL
jgi:CRISPR/Cas system-associated endonuclease Cas1